MIYSARNKNIGYNSRLASIHNYVTLKNPLNITTTIPQQEGLNQG